MKRILCVDDNQEILDIYEIILTSEGYVVRTSIFPIDILLLIVEFEPDLIILDINMPKVNGLEICKELKCHISHKSIPVIIISSDDSIHTAVCDFSATAIILKPFEIEDLLHSVQFHIVKPLTA